MLTYLPVFLAGESHGQWSLVGYSPWGCRDSDMTEHARTQYINRDTDGIGPTRWVPREWIVCVYLMAAGASGRWLNMTLGVSGRIFVDETSTRMGRLKQADCCPSVGEPRLIGWRSGQTRTADLPEVRESPSCPTPPRGPGSPPAWGPEEEHQLFLGVQLVASPADLRTCQPPWHHEPIPRSRYLSIVYLSIYPPTHSPVCLISQSTYLSVHPFTILPSYLSIIICSANNLPRDLYTFPSIHSPVYHLSI